MKRLLLMAVMAASTLAHAQFWDGNKLYHEMTGSTNDKLMALGYVVGVADALGNVTHCAPANVTAGQVFDMTRQYLEENPSLRHFSADLIVSRVMGRVWPCAKQKGNAL